ncbi:hypothetical protein [Citrobacter sp. CK202]|jgi:hypothetical protein|uniref:hypothetical protein n=1 Tax=Citrobacter sp. CK202 TaxID=2985111 RepID=UPI002578F97B|nr:hypothetical protein [Citrobacter sp. CK202]MDM2958747.1 hypothetical protein [Citrobacter sp. CK202]
MTERGMIFNGEMVRAILDGRKTQTRRIIKPQPEATLSGSLSGKWLSRPLNGLLLPKIEDIAIHCPFGAVGDRIWVRETWARYNIDQDSHDMAYRATPPTDWPEEGRWRPSIHMPRWASRILLEITDVRVERLNAISEEDARAEGIIDGGCLNCGEPEPCGCVNPQPDATDVFAYLWQSIYGQENWDANPWVWVIEFRRIDGGDHAY